MMIYVVSFVARSDELMDYVGVQGSFSTEEKANKFMRGLWEMQQETPIDYERVDEWTEEYITDKAIYTTSTTQLDYLIDDDE